MLSLLMLGCATSTPLPPSSPAALDAVSTQVRPLMHEHTEALIANNRDRILITGQNLISTLDCVLPDPVMCKSKEE